MAVPIPARTFDGEPVFPRPSVGDTSHPIACSCGETFSGRVDAIAGYGDPVDLAFVTHASAGGGCGSTRVFQVELDRDVARRMRLEGRRLFERIDPVHLGAAELGL